jgi:hypothetical protein
MTMPNYFLICFTVPNTLPTLTLASNLTGTWWASSENQTRKVPPPSQIAASAALAVKGQNDIAKPFPLSQLLCHLKRAKPIRIDEGLKKVIDSDSSQFRKKTRGDGTSRDLMNRFAIKRGLMLKLYREFSSVDCGEKKHPGRRVPTNFVNQSFSGWNDCRGRPQLVCCGRKNRQGR